MPTQDPIPLSRFRRLARDYASVMRLVDAHGILPLWTDGRVLTFLEDFQYIGDSLLNADPKRDFELVYKFLERAILKGNGNVAECYVSSNIAPSSLAYLIGGDDVWIVAGEQPYCHHCGTRIGRRTLEYAWVSDGEIVCCDPSEDEEEENDLLEYNADPTRSLRAFRTGNGDKPYSKRPIKKRLGRSGISATKNGEPIWIGVELEVQAISDRSRAVAFCHSTIGDIAICKSDGSLDGELGFEICSVPGTLAFHREAWNAFFEKASGYMVAWDTQDDYGLHVHVARDSLGALACGRLMAFIHNPDNYDFLKKLAGRGGTDYVYYQGDTEAKNILHGQRAHYDAAGPSHNHPTIEIRIFRASVRKERFIRNLEFVESLCRWCMSGPGVAAKALYWERYLAWLMHPAIRADYPEMVSWVRRSFKVYAKKPRKSIPA